MESHERNLRRNWREEVRSPWLVVVGRIHGTLGIDEEVWLERGLNTLEIIRRLAELEEIAEIAVRPLIRETAQVTRVDVAQIENFLDEFENGAEVKSRGVVVDRSGGSIGGNHQQGNAKAVA